MRKICALAQWVCFLLLFSSYPLAHAATVTVVGGVCEFTDSAGQDDELEMRLSGGHVVFQDLVNGITAGTGATQIDPFSVEVPLSSIAGGILIIEGGGEDLLTFNVTGGLLHGLTVGVEGGGFGQGDRLVIDGASLDEATFLAFNAGEGLLELALGGTVMEFNFFNQDFVEVATPTSTITLNTTAASETINVVNGPADTLLFGGTDMTPLVLNPPGELRLSASAGADTLILDSDVANTTAFILDGENDADDVFISRNPVCQSLEVIAENIHFDVDQVITAGAQEYDGTIRFAPGFRQVHLTAASGVELTGALNLFIDGPTPGVDQDQLQVIGSTTLQAIDLELELRYLPLVGDQYTLVRSDALTGEFANAPNGSVVTVGNERFRINYQGGSGNDIVLEYLPFSVESVSVPHDTRLTVFPTELTIRFSEPHLPSSVDAGDLVVAGLPAISFAEVDAQTITFTLDPAGNLGDGVYSVEFAAGTVSRNSDSRPVETHFSTFVVDTTAPKLISTALEPGAVYNSPEFTFTLGFDEAMDLAQFHTGNITLVGQANGPIFFTSGDYDFTNNVATLNYLLPEDDYTLTLVSGGLTDIAGNDLDGEPLGPNPGGLPTGDGTPGGDYSIDFSVEFDNTRLSEFEAVEPLGGLVYRKTVAGTIGPGDTDTFLLDVDPGASLQWIVTPDASLAVDLTIRGGIVVEESEPIPGRPLSVHYGAFPFPGQYTIEISGHAGTTGNYTFEVLMNALVEEESQDGPRNDFGLGSEQIDTAFNVLGDHGAMRGSVLGSLEPKLTPLNLFISPGRDAPGPWHASTGRSGDGLPNHSPPDSWYFGVGEGPAGGGTYANVQTGRLYSSAMQMTEGAQVRFNHFLEIEQGFDIATIEYNQEDKAIGKIADSEGALTRNTGGWVTEEFPAGANPGDFVSFEFSVTTDVSVVREGWYIDDLVFVELDEDNYTVNLEAGERGNFYCTALNGATTAPTMRLIGTDGATVLAAASSLIGQSIIAAFVAPAQGTYTIRLSGASGTDYHLLMMRSAALEIEPNDGIGTNHFLQDFNSCVLGHLEGNIVNEDVLRLPGLTVGDRLAVSTATPGGGAFEFVNHLDPVMGLYDASANLLSIDDNSAPDGRNAVLAYEVTTDGDHFLSIDGQGPVSGEYLLTFQHARIGEDADMDGLADVWELEHGLRIDDDGSKNIVNGPMGDPDGDFANNREEQEAGTNPQDPASSFRIVSQIPDLSGTQINFTTEANEVYAIDHGALNPDGSTTWTPFYDGADGTGTFLAPDASGGSLFDRHDFGTGGADSTHSFRSYRMRLNAPFFGTAGVLDDNGIPWFFDFEGSARPDPAGDPMFIVFGYTSTDLREGARLAQGITALDEFGQMEIVRRIYLSTAGSFVRYLEVMHNPTTTTAIPLLSITSTFGSTAPWDVITTSSGDNVVEFTDGWMLADDGDGSGQPARLFLYAGPGLELTFPASSPAVPLSTFRYGTQPNIAPGETKIFMHFGIQANSQVAALTRVASLITLPPEALIGISNADRQRIVNFNVPLH